MGEKSFNKYEMADGLVIANVGFVRLKGNWDIGESGMGKE